MRQTWADERWECCECANLNPVRQLYCKNCGKRRWAQLGLSDEDAAVLVLVRKRAAEGQVEYDV
jgi:hypothetical protein